MKCYEPCIKKILLESGEEVEALIFYPISTHEQYAGNLSEEKKVNIIRTSRGSKGTNLEYLEQTLTSLEKHCNIIDERLKDLLLKAKQEKLSPGVLQNNLFQKFELGPSQIWPNLFLGDAFHASNEKSLKSLGINHILNVAGNIPVVLDRSKFEICHLNIRDNTDENIFQHFNTCFKFLDKCLENSGKVLIHCHAGVSRSSTIGKIVLSF
jgi:hypothetical protein